MAKYRIGYIDEDEKEVKAFREILSKYDIDIIGYDFKVGMTKDELLEQVYSSDIDLLLIDYKLKGAMVTFNGEEIENDIYDKKPKFPYVIFTSDPSHAEDFVEDWKVIYDKEELFVKNKSRNDRFVKILKKSIEQYKNHISTKKEKLSQLLLKNKNEGLNAVEKDNLLKLQRELKNLDQTQKNEVPEQLLKPEIIELNENLKQEADLLLQQLIEKRKGL